MASNVTLVRASSFYTISAAADLVNAETLVIAGKTYTVQTTLTDVDGNVNIGADIAGTISNLVAAINLSNEGESAVGAATDYALAMTRNPSVHATTSTDTLTCSALIPGDHGNTITLTVGTSATTVDNATLENGSGNIASWLEGVLVLNQINAEVMYELKTLTPAAD